VSSVHFRLGGRIPFSGSLFLRHYAMLSSSGLEMTPDRASFTLHARHYFLVTFGFLVRPASPLWTAC
jgi:hypothetical protein